MRNLIAFILKHRNVFLFIALQFVAFLLIFNNLAFQRSTMLNSSARWSGSVLEQYHFFREYLNLSKTNERLVRENAMLRSALKDAHFQVYAVSREKVDTLYQQRFQYLDAKVVNSSFNKRNNHMTINKGSVHGIEKGMAVTSPDGVVGVVKDISRHFATVIPILHSRSMIGGKIKDIGFFGPVSWNGRHFRRAQLTEIPKHAGVQLGDSILTDGRSDVFPAGEFIGVVQQVELDPQSGFLIIEANLGVDFSRLEHVYVIRDFMILEQKELENRQQHGN
jgi:rod shape-determining protein MreC